MPKTGRSGAPSSLRRDHKIPQEAQIIQQRRSCNSREKFQLQTKERTQHRIQRNKKHARRVRAAVPVLFPSATGIFIAQFCSPLALNVNVQNQSFQFIFGEDLTGRPLFKLCLAYVHAAKKTLVLCRFWRRRTVSAPRGERRILSAIEVVFASRSMVR